ncbi:MAG TPA: C45 family autoproteolytic acyltransferase/hydrolase [Gemmataceae bacterium]|nr:C45 family autoproteolytic acyltransferase/hydrolase [Gemmataceae bacterium]
MVPWVERPTITLDLARIRRGEPPDIPPDAVASAKALLDEVMASIPPRARFLAYLIALRTGNRFGAEFRAAARLIDGDPRDIALANISYDLVVGALGCSTVAVPTPDGPVIARNMDWWPEEPLARASYVIRCTEGDDWRFSSAGFPGAVGVVTGLSSRGFAVILNAVTTTDPVCKTGYPVLLHLRRVMEDAADFDDALAMLSRQKLTTPALFTLVGSKNDQRVVVERAPKRHALLWGRMTEPLITTNNYHLLDLPPSERDDWELSRTSCGRYGRLCELTARRGNGTPTDDELLYWLQDEQVRQEITAQHVLIRSARGEMKLFVPRWLVP